MRRRARAAARALVALLVLRVAPCLAAPRFSLGSPDRVYRAGPASLGFSTPRPEATDGPAGLSGLDEPPALPPAPRPLLDGRSAWLTAGVLTVTPLLGYFAWWRGEPTGEFVVAHEGWLGATTYAGGADKLSHFWAGWAAEHLLESAYRSLGRTEREARVLSVGVTSLAGLLIEAGDGFSQYGAAWEDAAMDAFGAIASSQVGRLGLRDTVGVRIGRVPSTIPAPCCRFGGYGADYSKEIYTLDLKLAGFLPRVGAEAGPARYFLVSLAFGSRGYRYSPAWARERNVGVELGLNVVEILRGAGVPEERWWGAALLSIFSYVRLPFTSVGLYYDLNHSRWWGGVYGPGWDPGYIIYD